MRQRSIFAVIAAGLCSLALTLLTTAPPLIPTDWARLGQNGVYISRPINYPWPDYAAQVALWLALLGLLLWAGKENNLTAEGAEKHRGKNNKIRLKSRMSETRGLSPLFKAKITTSVHEPKILSASQCSVASLTWLSILFLTLLGFGLRLHTLNQLPLISDEIGFAAHASDILHGQQAPIFAPGHNGNPSVYSWLVSLAMTVFGQTRFAIRLWPLVIGTVTIPAAYQFGRAWGSPRIGLLAAAFLATYPAHIFFSRLSLYNLADPLFAMLALTFLARALKRNRRLDYTLAGVLAAGAQYFYHGARMLPVLMAVYVVLSLRRQGFKIPDGLWRRGAMHRAPTSDWRRKPMLNLLWMTLVFILLTAPEFVTLAAHHLPLTGNREALRLPADMAENSLRALLAWVGQPDVSPFWLSAAPLLLLPALLAFAGGVVIALRRWRDARSAPLILSLILTTVFGGAILTAAPLYVRYMTALPAVVLLAAMGLDALAKRWRKLAAAAALVICLQGIWVAGVQHPAEADSRISPGLRFEDDIAQQAASLPSRQPAIFAVPPTFTAVERITIADYIAAYGQRRTVVITLG